MVVVAGELNGGGVAEEEDSDEEIMHKAAQRKYEAFNKMYADILDPGMCVCVRACVCVHCVH